MKRKSLILAIIILFSITGVSCTGISDLRNSKRHSTKKITPRENIYLKCEKKNDAQDIPACLRKKDDYSLHNRLPQNVAVDKEGCPVDGDADGVPDYRDICPDTAPCVSVDEHGCAVDSDNDGVCDSFDQCPGTEDGVLVDESGCPVDSDGDGVGDIDDQCPDTPYGARVNENGCWVIDDILFEFNRADIRPMYMYLLDEVADVISWNHNIDVEIQGHTCMIGSEQYNQQLSEKRAEAVREYLIERGIGEERVYATGFGEMKPCVGQITEEGRALNRRAVILRIE